ncbi:MAG: glycerol kinase GlpK [Eubacteriales bacterium]
MREKYILSLDQGTTSCRAILFNNDGIIEAIAQKEFIQIYPNAGWIEHNPMEIWRTQLDVIKKVIKKGGITYNEIASIGITNQRETTVIWDKNTGKPIYNAIVWQSRQTAEICEEIKEKGLSDYIKKSTGLVIDAYFSASKIMWILDKVDGSREKAEKGDLLFGTIDTWLVWNLTGGKVHVTDYSNASRTMLFNIDFLDWDDKLLQELKIPESMLPEVKPSSYLYGYVDENLFDGVRLPISGIAGDQQAALFGQTCFEAGMVKNTYGTGCFILMQTGQKRIISENGLITTIAWGIDNKVEYALEGSIFMGGAVVAWLRDELKLINSSKESEYFASQVENTNGVYLVPAFSGLGAPYWDMYARGAIVGLTRGANRNHIIRAALEAIAYQSKDVIEAMIQDSNLPLHTIKVDGGASANNFLMQFQADILNAVVKRPNDIETTALGAAFLAGLGIGYWSDKDELNQLMKNEKIYKCKMDRSIQNEKIKGWKKAIERAKDWE